MRQTGPVTAATEIQPETVDAEASGSGDVRQKPAGPAAAS